MTANNLLPYLIEFRQRLLRCVLVLALVFALLFFFSDFLYTGLAAPLLKYLPQGHGLIATHVLSPFLVPFRLTFVVSLFLTIPFFLHQLWAFIAPALYQHERYLIWPLLLISIVLFYVGTAFAYFVVFPLLFHFLVKTAPVGVMVSPDINQYLDFTLKLFFTFGVIFEVPVITFLLVWTGVTQWQTLSRMRSYVIVACFIIAMLLAPPDVFSQVVVAVPLWLLFEIGLLLSRVLHFEKSRSDES